MFSSEHLRQNQKATGITALYSDLVRCLIWSSVPLEMPYSERDINFLFVFFTLNLGFHSFSLCSWVTWTAEENKAIPLWVSGKRQAYILAKINLAKVIIYEELLHTEFNFHTVLQLMWLLPAFICSLACYWHHLTVSLNDLGTQTGIRTEKFILFYGLIDEVFQADTVFLL